MTSSNRGAGRTPRALVLLASFLLLPAHAPAQTAAKAPTPTPIPTLGKGTFLGMPLLVTGIERRSEDTWGKPNDPNAQILVVHYALVRSAADAEKPIVLEGLKVVDVAGKVYDSPFKRQTLNPTKKPVTAGEPLVLEGPFVVPKGTKVKEFRIGGVAIPLPGGPY